MFITETMTAAAYRGKRRFQFKCGRPALGKGRRRAWNFQAAISPVSPVLLAGGISRKHCEASSVFEYVTHKLVSVASICRRVDPCAPLLLLIAPVFLLRKSVMHSIVSDRLVSTSLACVH